MSSAVEGFTVTGTWEDVVEHGERVSYALQQVGATNGNAPSGLNEDEAWQLFTQWEEWRPKREEELDDEMDQKTAEQASIGEGEGERKGREPQEDMQRAGERFTSGLRESNGDLNTLVGKFTESTSYVARALDSVGRRMLRSLEEVIYRRVMTRIAPYYFDNPLVSASIHRENGGRPQPAPGTNEPNADEMDEDPDEMFVLEVHVHDDDLKDAVDRHLHGEDATA